MPTELLQETIGKKTYVQSPELENIANHVIETQDLHLHPARVKYFLVYPLVANGVAGRCYRANNHVKIFGQADYIIEISGDVWDNLDDDVREILVTHELYHIMPKMKKDGEWTFQLRPHDVEDFACLIEQYGLGWLNGIREGFAKALDVEVEELEHISF